MRDARPPTPDQTAATPGRGGRVRAWQMAALALLPLLAAVGWWAHGRLGRGDADPHPHPLPRMAAADLAAGTADTGDAAPASALRLPDPAELSPLRRQFETTDDLYAFARDLAPAVQRGDPEALWLMSKVADYCAGYSLDPAGYASDTRVLSRMRLPGGHTMAAARERMGRRCRRFAASDGLSPALVLQLREQAAQAGSVAAEAALLATGRPLRSDEAYARDLVSRVRESLDPDAFNALSTASAGGGSLFSFSQPQAPPQFNQLAWQLAACRLGLECGPDSSLMTQYCVNGGICSRDPAQGFEAFVFDAAVPRQSEDVLRGMVQTLIGSDGGNT